MLRIITDNIRNIVVVYKTYLFFDVFFLMTGSFDNFPEIHELIELNLTVVIVVDSIEKLLCRYLAEECSWPMLNSFISINSFWTVFVKLIEYILDNVLYFLR